MNFKKWLEMAHFSVKQPNLYIPCATIQIPCLEEPIGAIDMRFEDPDAYSAPYNKLNNWSKFSAIMPKTNKVLIFHGQSEDVSLLNIEQAIKDEYIPNIDGKINRENGAISSKGYFLVPDDWFIHAQIFNSNYQIIKPALADENGKR